MRLFEIHVIHKFDRDDADRLSRIENLLGSIIRNQETSMLDTSKILAAVAAEKTESASLRALVTAQSQAMKDLGTQLQAAISANDPAALAKVQADLDQAATDLNADNDAAAAAIAANTTPAPASAASA
jgi:hypothetical protein